MAAPAWLHQFYPSNTKLNKLRHSTPYSLKVRRLNSRRTRLNDLWFTDSLVFLSLQESDSTFANGSQDCPAETYRLIHEIPFLHIFPSLLELKVGPIRLWYVVFVSPVQVIPAPSGCQAEDRGHPVDAEQRCQRSRPPLQLAAAEGELTDAGLLGTAVTVSCSL